MKFLISLLVLLSVGWSGNHLARQGLPAATQRPAETSTVPDTSEAPDYRLMPLGEVKFVEGCAYSLWPEGGSIQRLVFLFSSHHGTGEAFLDGRAQSFELISESDGRPTLGGTKTFVHQNETYDVTTVVTFEGMHFQEEVWDLSGKVTFRERVSGKTITVAIAGDQGC